MRKPCKKICNSRTADISTRKSILKPSSSASVQKTLILSLGSLGHCFYSMLTICTPVLVYSFGCMQRMSCRNTRNASVEAGQDGQVWKHCYFKDIATYCFFVTWYKKAPNQFFMWTLCYQWHSDTSFPHCFWDLESTGLKSGCTKLSSKSIAHAMIII